MRGAREPTDTLRPASGSKDQEAVGSLELGGLRDGGGGTEEAGGAGAGGKRPVRSREIMRDRAGMDGARRRKQGEALREVPLHRGT